MIISASRRTDIPAFYSEWFVNRLRAGYLLTRNPFNAHQVSKVSLLPEDVTAIVFWTRNPTPLMKHLKEIDRSGYRYYFQYTITGYPKILETSVPRPHRALETFSKLSDLVGANRVIWRYDPVLLSAKMDMDEHKRLFVKIADSLASKTRRVVVSFADLYTKVNRNLAKVDQLQPWDIVEHRDKLSELAFFFSKTAGERGLEIQSCAEDVDLSKEGIEHGKCIDDQLIGSVLKVESDHAKDKGQREACGCVKSVDIGMYNTCLHGCAYCYATANKSLALKNHEKHDPNSPFLIGQPKDTDQVKTVEGKGPIQETLF
ncbi:MAG: DUF1848 domain-containing protein [bacterium]|nr:DUF1848 domain-containing protein [bacterium]